MSIRKLLQLFVILFALFSISCNQKRQEGTIDDPRDLELPRKVTD